MKPFWAIFLRKDGGRFFLPAHFFWHCFSYTWSLASHFILVILSHNHTSSTHLFLPKSSLYSPVLMLSFPDGGSHSIQLDVLPPALLSHKLRHATPVLRHSLHKHCDLASLHLTSYACKRDSWERNALRSRGFFVWSAQYHGILQIHHSFLTAHTGSCCFGQEPRASLHFEEGLCFSSWGTAS